jgi:hypothetical protein
MPISVIPFRLPRGTRRVLAVVCALTVLATGSAAHAAKYLGLAFDSFGTPFVIDPTLGPYWLDYTLPTDGRLYLWTFSYASADPNSAFYVPAPNEVDQYFNYKTDDDLTFSTNGPNGMQFQETATPGLTSILYQAPLAFNTCATAGTSNVTPCSAQYNIWGNADPFAVIGASPLTITETLTAIPEPAEWAMLLAGFGGLGAALRRRRRSPRPALVL